MQLNFTHPQSATAVIFGDKVKLISRADNPAYNAGVLAGKMLSEGKLTEAQVCESFGLSSLENSDVGRIALEYQRVHGKQNA